MDDQDQGAATALLARVSKRAKFLNPRFSTLAVSAAAAAEEAAGEGGSHAVVEEGAAPPAMSEGEAAAAPEGASREAEAARLMAAATATHESNAQDTVLNSNDMLKILFSCLEMEDLCSSAMVSKQWHAISQAEEFWHSISFEDRCVSPFQVRALLQRHPNVTSLNLVGLRPADHQLLATTCASLRGLVSLELGKSPLTEQDLGTIGNRLRSLRSLRITDSNLGRFGPGEVVMAHDHLTKLEALGCCVTRLAVRCPRLVSLSLQDTALSAFLPSCPGLLSLDLKGCSKIRDSELRAALIRLPTLVHLDLTANLPLSDDTVREVATRCPALESVVLANCIAVSLTSVRGFGSLRVLDLSNCDSLNSSSALPVLETFTALEEIIMDNCGLLVQVVLTLPRLRVMSLRSCRSLERVKLECRSLTDLRLGRIEAGGPGCGALKYILLASDAIQSISWRAFPMLQTVLLRCPNLQDLDLSDCDSLEDSIFASVGNGPGHNGSGPGPLPPPDPDAPGPSSLRPERGDRLRLARLHAMMQAEANLSEEEDDDVDVMLQDYGDIIEILDDASTDEEVAAAAPPAPPPPPPPAAAAPVVVPMAAAAPPSASAAASSGHQGPSFGCPRLRSLRLDCCEGLDKAELHSTSLATLSLAGCKGLSAVKLSCPALSSLRLDECDQIEAVEVADVAVAAMSLGTCPSLGSLSVSAPRLSQLDLKGCGLLERLSLRCPSLVSLDATFCSSLGDDALRGALDGSPPLQQLVLSVCSSVGSRGLRALGSLSGLQRLDLSYTELEDLGAVVAACPLLESLNLSSCACLGPGALDALLPRVRRQQGLLQHQGPSTSSAPPPPPTSSSCSSSSCPAALTDLDVSYCQFPAEALSRLLAEGSALESLAASGCSGMQDGAWEGLAAPGPPHALHTLALVGCKSLKSCILGLRRSAEGPEAAGGEGALWEPHPTRLSGLVTLRVGLSSIQTLALSLPRLTLLDANGCGAIQELELRCPLLLACYFQACCGLSGRSLQGALSGSRQLEILDTQHMGITKEEMKDLRVLCPPLRNLLYTNPADA